MYGGRDVVLAEFSTVSAAAGLQCSGKHPLKQRIKAPQSVWLAFKALTLEQPAQTCSEKSLAKTVGQYREA